MAALCLHSPKAALSLAFRVSRGYERGTEGGTSCETDWPSLLAGLTSPYPFTESTLLNLPFPFCLCYLASLLLPCDYQMCLRAELSKMGAASHLWRFKFKLTEVKSNENFSFPVTPVTFPALHSHKLSYCTLKYRTPAEPQKVPWPFQITQKIILNSNKGAQLSMTVKCWRWTKSVMLSKIYPSIPHLDDGSQSCFWLVLLFIDLGSDRVSRMALTKFGEGRHLLGGCFRVLEGLFKNSQALLIFSEPHLLQWRIIEAHWGPSWGGVPKSLYLGSNPSLVAQ